MYESFYGLKEKPFNLTPDPDYLFMSQGHENAYTHLEYAISENKGFVVITGEIGSGKTTLINFLLRRLPEHSAVGVVNHTNVLPAQFLRMICQEFELDVDGKDKTDMLSAFQGFLLKQFGEGKRVVLIIDEAQNLPLKTIEEIRMLSNLESEKHHLLQIIMAGQPELNTLLRRKALEQFAQRVTVYCHLGALNPQEVREYIRHRLDVAGAVELDMFGKDALEAIHAYSHGIPRMVNILCDSALVYGYADERRVIDKRIVDEAAQSRKVGKFLLGGKTGQEDLASSGFVKSGHIELLEKRLDTIEKKINLLGNVVSRLNRNLGTWAEKNERLRKSTAEAIERLSAETDKARQLFLEQKEAVEQIVDVIGDGKKEISQGVRSRGNLLRLFRRHSP
jgi:general secretion pathway protein A